MPRWAVRTMLIGLHGGTLVRCTIEGRLGEFGAAREADASQHHEHGGSSHRKCITYLEGGEGVNYSDSQTLLAQNRTRIAFPRTRRAVQTSPPNSRCSSMALEAGAVALGLAGGFKLWKLVQAELSVRAEEEEQPTTSTETLARPGAPVRKIEGTLTVMLVGDSAVGKTLFCSRVVASTMRRTLAGDEGPTFAPTWLRAELDLQLDERVRRETRLCFHFLDTPGRAELEQLLAPFYRQAAALVLVFDVGSAASFQRMQTHWLAQVKAQRVQLTRQTAGSVVVLAQVLDERLERQVTRRDASSWCLHHQLPYFETHPKDNAAWKRMLLHLARVCLGHTRYTQQAPAAPSPESHTREALPLGPRIGEHDNVAVPRRVDSE